MAWELIPAGKALFAEFTAIAPNRDTASDGSIGDTAHQAESSDHNPDETGATPYEDADSINEVHAIDVDNNLNVGGRFDMQDCVDVIIRRCVSGAETRLQNVIYNRQIWSRTWGWTKRAYTGASAHTEHAHFSLRYGSGSAPGNPEQVTSTYGLLAALGDDDMNATEMTAWAKSPAGKEALALAVLTFDPGVDDKGAIKAGGVPNYAADAKSNPSIQPAWALGRGGLTAVLAYQLRDQLDAVAKAVALVLGNVQADDGDKAEILAALTAAQAAIPGAVLDGLADSSSSDAEVAAALKSALGSRSAAVGALLAGGKV